MWQLVDIAYVIPASVFIGYWVARFFETKYEGKFLVPVILSCAALGLVLTIVKIKRYIDSVNKK